MEHERVVVLSDVHGFAEKVRAVVDHYDNDVHYVFNGDCVDRGPDSKGVLDIIQETGGDLVLGNHEWVLLAALTERDTARQWGWGETWLFRTTTSRPYEDQCLTSYGQTRRSNPFETAHYLRARLQELGHLALLQAAPLYYETDDLLVVHAGLITNKPWQKQQAKLDKLDVLKKAGIFQAEPEQWESYRHALDLGRPADVHQTLVTGHAHLKADSHARSSGQNSTGIPRRVQLASFLNKGDSLFVYESWTGQIMPF